MSASMVSRFLILPGFLVLPLIAAVNARAANECKVEDRFNDGHGQVLAQSTPPMKTPPTSNPRLSKLEDVSVEGFLRVLRAEAYTPSQGRGTAIGRSGGTMPGSLRVWIDGKFRNKPTHYRVSSTGDISSRPWTEPHWGGVGRNAEDRFVGDMFVPDLAARGYTITLQLKNSALWSGIAQATFVHP